MAQIDSSIAMGVKPMQVENPMNALARVMQVKALQQQSEVNALTMQEKQRAIQEGNALNGVFRTPGFSWDDETHRNSAFSAAPLKAQELYKGHLEVEGKRGENKKRDFDMNKERFGVVRKAAAAFANDPNATRDRIVSTLQAYAIGGVIPEHLATQFAQSLPEDPAQLRQVLSNFAKQDLTSEQLFKLFAPTPTQVDNGQQISYRDTNPNSPTYGQMTGGAPVQKVMTPGEVASDQRGRDTLAETRRHHGVTEKNQASTLAQGKVPAGYRAKPDGSLEAIPGGPAANKSENATEGERKAATLLQRLEGSQRQLEAALKTNPGAAKPELLASGLRALGADPVANTITGTQRQQVEAAQLDMLDAALTLGTGAAYTREQLKGYRESYFPQIGDDEATVKDKTDRLNNVIQAAKIAAGRAAKGTATPQSGGASGGWGIKKVE